MNVADSLGGRILNDTKPPGEGGLRGSVNMMHLVDVVGWLEMEDRTTDRDLDGSVM